MLVKFHIFRVLMKALFVKKLTRAPFRPPQKIEPLQHGSNAGIEKKICFAHLRQSKD